MKTIKICPRVPTNFYSSVLRMWC